MEKNCLFRKWIGSLEILRIEYSRKRNCGMNFNFKFLF